MTSVYNNYVMFCKPPPVRRSMLIPFAAVSGCSIAWLLSWLFCFNLTELNARGLLRAFYLG